MASAAKKILEEHLTRGTLGQGKEIAIKIDQTLTQDATGTMACLQFESMNIPKVKTELSVSYVDHNTLQNGFMNADDHKYLQTVAAKYGIKFSRPGNGICHQVHAERFAFPGKTLLGSDSHTPTSGGVGMIAIGAGGLDVAVAMAGGPFHLKTPKILGVKLSGRLSPGVSAKDVILEVLRQIDVKGGVGKIIEYFGDGVKTLSVPERATITNMGAETGATTSIFPSDDVTKEFLKKQGREKDYVEIPAGTDEDFDEVVEINLSKLEPLVAKPHSPGKVAKVKDLKDLKVDQVCIGSCTNSSLKDLETVAAILDGKVVNQNVSLTISPGSRQVLEMLSESGALKKLLKAGARILECACGPCIGMGQSPPSKGVSVRTFNRNFEGRSGTKDAEIYLVSPETAAATALTGKLTDPREIDIPEIKLPKSFTIDDSMIIEPAEDGSKVEVVKGPNIKEVPVGKELEDKITGIVLLKVGDNITTDHIMPAGAKILPLRSNIPEISKHVFEQVDENFYKRAIENSGGFVVGGENYGQGSSREHAALAPMHLGVKAVIAKSFARIHKANLINFGILPLEFSDPKDYEKMGVGDEIVIDGLKTSLTSSSNEMTIKARGKEFKLKHDFDSRQKRVLLDGGLLNHTKKTAVKTDGNCFMQ
ncbi:MAG TPA: aconitate hydratase [Candidatus Altiarchaeales archaeon]|nr:aconitate hydratase [Candidatus Altiarchaeales archaeon]